jgi:SAM-dependent methyltransferase
MVIPGNVKHGSETSLARSRLAKYCNGFGLDIGFGGELIVPHALGFDLPRPYTKVGEDNQTFQGDARNLGFLCDESVDFIYSSHLVEDFTYEQLVPLIREWFRVLKKGGNLIIYCPDEVLYGAHCKATGQGYNLAHKNKDFSLGSFLTKVMYQTSLSYDLVYSNPAVDTYSWELVITKT